jgi:hypothetical protein
MTIPFYSTCFAFAVLIDSMTSLLSEADRRAEIERGLAPGGAKPHERGLSHFSGCISDTEVSMSSDSVVLVGLDVHVRPESRLSFCFTGEGMA